MADNFLRVLSMSFVVAALAGCTGGPPPPATPITTQLEGAWSDPATWGGALPDANSSVTIPAGKTVTLDATINVRNLTVMGTLVCADKDIKLTANWVMVHAPGKLECGTPTKPFTKRLEIVLNAKDETENAMGMGTKFFGAMGGTVDLHGASKTSWTRLEGTVEPGATQIRVLEASGWRVGDRIAIAPTDYEPTEAETRTVTAVNGNTLSLEPPLKFRHWGKVQPLGATGATLDERAEVANLSRSITVRGENAPGSNFGAHTMFMTGSTVRLSNIEVSGAGQLGKLGRYPVHFHLLGDGGKGSYLKDSSIHDNFQRGVVIHRSNDLLIQNNSVYNTVGHMVFLESSNEVRNTFDRNLVMLTRPVPTDKMNPDLGFEFSPDSLGATMSKTARVSGFWISNGYNTFTGNTVAAIAHGHGYWFVEGSALYTTRDNDLWPYRPGGDQNPPYQGRTVFEGNTAHTLNPTAEFKSHSMAPAGNAVMFDSVYFEPSYAPTIKDLRVWKTTMYAVWSLPPQTLQAQAPLVENLIVADAKSAFASVESNKPLAARGGVYYGMTDNQPPGVDFRTRDYDAMLAAVNDSNDRSIEPVSTYPDRLLLKPKDGPASQVDATTPGIVTGGQRFTEFSNIFFGGWPQ